jgi:hypothetical protein
LESAIWEIEAASGEGIYLLELLLMQRLHGREDTPDSAPLNEGLYGGFFEPSGLTNLHIRQLAAVHERVQHRAGDGKLLSCFPNSQEHKSCPFCIVALRLEK